MPLFVCEASIMVRLHLEGRKRQSNCPSRYQTVESALESQPRARGGFSEADSHLLLSEPLGSMSSGSYWLLTRSQDARVYRDQKDASWTRKNSRPLVWKSELGL